MSYLTLTRDSKINPVSSISLAAIDFSKPVLSETPASHLVQNCCLGNIIINMKLVQFVKKSSKEVKRVGVQLQDAILDLTEGLGIKSALEFIQGGSEMMKKAER